MREQTAVPKIILSQRDYFIYDMLEQEEVRHDVVEVTHITYRKLRRI